LPLRVMRMAAAPTVAVQAATGAGWGRFLIGPVTCPARNGRRGRDRVSAEHTAPGRLG